MLARFSCVEKLIVVGNGLCAVPFYVQKVDSSRPHFYDKIKVQNSHGVLQENLTQHRRAGACSCRKFMRYSRAIRESPLRTNYTRLRRVGRPRPTVIFFQNFAGCPDAKKVESRRHNFYVIRRCFLKRKISEETKKTLPRQNRLRSVLIFVYATGQTQPNLSSTLPH